MKQRVVVQAVLKSGDKILLLHRSQGSPAIVGKYELPGGTLEQGEQPEDATRRHVRDATGLTTGLIKLSDVFSMISREEGDIQHIIISYILTDIPENAPVFLGRSYDAYQWVVMSQLHQLGLRDSTRLLLDTDLSSDLLLLSEGGMLPDDAIKTSVTNQYTIYTDGGSRGNPGPSAAAFIIEDSRHQIIAQGGGYLGITTNNQAEYQGVKLGLERAVELGLTLIEFRVDSMLVVNQMKGVYKIKNRELWPINERIRTLMAEFQQVTFTHIPRELNQAADLLVNNLLDEHQSDPVVV